MVLLTVEEARATFVRLMNDLKDANRFLYAGKGTTGAESVEDCGYTTNQKEWANDLWLFIIGSPSPPVPPSPSPPPEKKVHVFSRPECIFQYCPHPELCQGNCVSPDPNPTKTPPETPDDGYPIPVEGNHRCLLMEKKIGDKAAGSCDGCKIAGCAAKGRMSKE